MIARNIANYTPHPYISIFFLIAFIFLYYNSQPLLHAPDVGWHIAAGHYIAAEGLPKTDPWSYTAGDQPWYNISWGWDLLIGTIAQYTGLEGLYTFSVTFTAFIIMFLGYSLFSRKNLHEDPISITVCIAGLVIWHTMYARPHLVTYLMVIVFQHFLHHSRQQPERLLPYLILPLSMIIWVNSHGGFLAGFVIIGIYVIEAYKEKDTPWLIRLIICGILSTLACLCNPYGIDIIAAVNSTLFSSMTAYINEWRVFTYGEHIGISVFFLVFVFASNFKDPDIPLADKLLAALWFIAAILSVRNFGPFALLASPFIAQCLQSSIKLHTHKNIDIPKNRIGLSIASILLVTIYMTPSIRQHLDIRNVLEEEGRTPLAAIHFISENHPNIRFMNEYDFGGYIAFYNPSIGLFVDGRAGTAYSEDIINKTIKFTYKEPGWEHLIEEYNIGGLLVKPETILPKSIENDWVKTFEMPVAHVYVHKKYLGQTTTEQSVSTPHKEPPLLHDSDSLLPQH